MIRTRSILLGLALLVVAWFGWRFATQEEIRLFALDGASGGLVWSAGLNERPVRPISPVVAGGRVFVQVAAHNESGLDRWELAVFEAASGQALWTWQPSPDLGRWTCKARLSFHPM